jgi:hypothetical protein
MTAKRTRPRAESLADLLRDVLVLEAQKQGKPPPTDEECGRFLRLMSGLPTGPDEVPAEGEKGGDA